MKKCTKCNLFLDFTKFFKDKQKKDGYRSSCIMCDKDRKLIYNQKLENKIRKAAINKIWAAKNRKKCNERSSTWAKNNKEKVREIFRKIRQNRRGAYTHYSQIRRAKILERIPKWLTKEQKNQIYEIFKLAKIMSDNETKYCVDHIIPLNNTMVSGLHVPWNLQILTISENAKKTNKFDGTMDNKDWINGTR